MNAKNELHIVSQFIDSFPEGILLLDQNNTVVRLNNKVLDNLYLDGKIEDYIGMHLPSFLERSISDQSIRNLLTNNTTDQDFKVFKLRYTFLAVSLRHSPLGIMMLFKDVSETIKSKNTALKNLIKGQEQERIRIAKEIHDGIGPSLSTIRVAIDMVSRKVPDVQSNKLKELSTYIAEISQNIREISHDLMPPSLLDFGIKSALENLFSRIKNTTEVNFIYTIDLPDNQNLLSITQSLNLYRIIQEAIHNGIKHGSANCFTIAISTHSKGIQLSVKDNGTKEYKPVAPGIGLKNMRARVNSMNGTLRVRATKPSGFEIKAKIPIT